MDLIKQNKFLLSDYFKSRGVAYKESGNNIGDGWIGVSTCPVCGDHRYHFGVNKESHNFSCWVCGAHGGLKRLITLIDDIPFSEVSDVIREFSIEEGYLPPAKVIVKNTKLTVELPSTILPLYDAFHRYPYVFQYLQKRGFSVSDIQGWNAYFCYSGEYAERIIFPIYFGTRLVTFTGRAVLPTSKRYKTLPKTESLMSIKDCLFNWDNVDENTHVILVEGIFDALKVDKLVGDNGVGVAISGKTVSGAQKVLMLKKKFAKLTILLDKDAWFAGMRICTELQSLLSCPVTMSLLACDDPGSANSLEELNIEW